MITISPPSASTGKHSTPAAWVRGARARYVGRPRNGYPISVSAVIVSRLALVSITPLGRPVVPPVPTIIARSATPLSTTGFGAPTGTPSTVASGSRNCSQVSAPSTTPSRQTRTASLGRSGAMAATRGANDFWNSSAVQSNRSRSSRFSAASLRGLMGHHTAPAREIPKTHVNDVGSLADRIATDCPGATPRRARASATLREVSRTSA